MTASRGAALPAVLFTVAIGSALVVGGAYLTRQLAATAATAHRGAGIEPAAELAIVAELAGWDSAGRSDQVVGATTASPPQVLEGASVRLWVTRLSARTYWIVAEARGRGKPLLQRRLGALVDWEPGALPLVPIRGWAELP